MTRWQQQLSEAWEGTVLAAAYVVAVLIGLYVWYGLGQIAKWVLTHIGLL